MNNSIGKHDKSNNNVKNATSKQINEPRKLSAVLSVSTSDLVYKIKKVVPIYIRLK